MKKFFLIFSMLAATLSSEMCEPYKSIKDLPFDNHGWFFNERQLLAIIESHNPKIIIEVGSWLGCSTRFMASHLKEDGVLYAVDTWRGSPAEDVHMKDPRLPYLYQLFLSNVKHAGLTEKIIPVRMESIEAASALNLLADLIYLDASHDTVSVYNDIMAWHPHLQEGGVLCGDDWSWPTVRIAVEKAAKQLNKRVTASGNFWQFE